MSGEAEGQPDRAAQEGPWALPLPNRVGEMLMAAAILGAAVFFIWQSLYLPFGGVGLPGPGFFPFALGVVLAAFAVAIFARVMREPDGDPVHLGHRDVLVVFAALVGVALTFESLGSYASLGAFVAILLLVIARSALWRIALGTGLGMVAVWVVFKILLGVQLPTGPF